MTYFEAICLLAFIVYMNFIVYVWLSRKLVIRATELNERLRSRVENLERASNRISQNLNFLRAAIIDNEGKTEEALRQEWCELELPGFGMTEREYRDYFSYLYRNMQALNTDYSILNQRISDMEEKTCSSTK